MALIRILEGVLFLGILLRLFLLLGLLNLVELPLLHVFLVASFQVTPLFIVHADELQRSDSFGLLELFLHIHSLDIRFIAEVFFLLIKLELGLLKWVVLLESDVHHGRLRTFPQTHTPFAGVVWVRGFSFFDVFNHLPTLNILDLVTEYLYRSSSRRQAVGTVAIFVDILLRKVVGAVHLLIRRTCRSSCLTSPRRRSSPGRGVHLCIRLGKAHMLDLLATVCAASTTRLTWCLRCWRERIHFCLLFLDWHSVFVLLDQFVVFPASLLRNLGEILESLGLLPVKEDIRILTLDFFPVSNSTDLSVRKMIPRSVSGIEAICRVLAVRGRSLVVDSCIELKIKVFLVYLATSHKLSHINLKWEIDVLLDLVLILHSFNTENQDWTNLDNLLSFADRGLFPALVAKET